MALHALKELGSLSCGPSMRVHMAGNPAAARSSARSACAGEHALHAVACSGVWPGSTSCLGQRLMYNST
eukprot:12135317-Alexandrium_andersonii.AAC.1